MGTVFKFDSQQNFMQEIELSDPGNVCLHSETEGDDAYLIVKTIMGRTTIIRFGPVIAGWDVMPNCFNLYVKQFNYKDTKVNKEIDSFLNDSYLKAVAVTEVTLEEAIKAMPSLEETIKQL